jgi:hypothetical protein
MTMDKKNYQKPVIESVEFDEADSLLNINSKIKSTSTNLGEDDISFGGASSTGARSREDGDWSVGENNE